MIQLFRDYLPDMRTLNVISTKSKEIVHIIDNDEFSIETKKGFYCAIVAYLKVLKIPKELYDTAYKNYKDFLDTLPKEIHYRKKTLEDYGGYDWVKLRKRAHEIIVDPDTPDQTKLILALYTDLIPRRTSDFLKMHINKKDDKNFNLLTFKKTGGRYFTINVWKNSLSKTRKHKVVNTQIIDIVNKHL